MSFENITAPIKVESLKDHESIIRDRMVDLQLEYIDRLLKNLIPKPVEEIEMSFSNLLIKYSFFKKIIKIEYRKRNNYDEGNNEEKNKFEDMLKKISEKCSLIYEKHEEDWKDKIKILMMEEINNLPLTHNVEISEAIETIFAEDHEEKEGLAGLIEYEICDEVEDFKEAGIDPDDLCIRIHFENYFKQVKENDGAKKISINDSFVELAKKIVEEDNYVKAIIAKSWLMNTNRANRIGFHIINVKKEPSSNSGFWGQFIDKDGQINKKNVEQLMLTGKAPYYQAKGYMMTEEFLKKYLPENMRGEITLKVPDPEFEKRYEEQKAVFEKMKNNWDKININQIQEILNESELVREYLKTEDGNDLINLLGILKIGDKDYKSTQENIIANRFHEIYDEFLIGKKYIDKKIII